MSDQMQAAHARDMYRDQLMREADLTLKEILDLRVLNVRDAGVVRTVRALLFEQRQRIVSRWA